MQTEEQALKKIQSYIDAGKYNSGGILWKISSNARTPKVVGLVLSHPGIFNIDKEISILSSESFDDRAVIKTILYNPNNFIKLSKIKCSMPMMVAFAISKRMHEYFASQGTPVLDSIHEEIVVPSIISENIESILYICNKITINYSAAYALEDPNDFVEYITQNILSYFDPSIKAVNVPNVEPFNHPSLCMTCCSEVCNDSVLLLISGCRQSGKTTIGQKLREYLKDSCFIDSDYLINNNLLGLPLAKIVPEDAEVVIFADIFAHRYFSSEELADYKVVNILVQPLANDMDTDHSKYVVSEFKELNNPIIVLNDYTELGIEKIIPKLIEKISRRVGYPLKVENPSFGGRGSNSLRRIR